MATRYGLFRPHLCTNQARKERNCENLETIGRYLAVQQCWVPSPASTSTKPNTAYVCYKVSNLLGAR
jgi:hypothetical protein